MNETTYKVQWQVEVDSRHVKQSQVQKMDVVLVPVDHGLQEEVQWLGHPAARKHLGLGLECGPVETALSVEGNENADIAAKEAAQGLSTPLTNSSILSQPLPRSKAAANASYTRENKVIWANQWKTSTKGKFTRCFDEAPPSAKVQ